MFKPFAETVLLIMLITLVSACGPAAPTSSPVAPAAPTSTPVAPVATTAPVPATGTSLPPTATATPTATPPEVTSSGEGLIAFVSTRDGNGEIYVMNADGSDQRRLTNYRQWDGYPAWSPDGEQIAYYSYLSDKEWVIKVMDADGGNPHQLTDNGICDAAPYWSPDGTRIAYTSAADCTAKQREIYVMRADGSGQMNLTQNDADDVGSSWSPDGTQLVFSSNRDGNYELYVMDVPPPESGTGGSNVHRLTDDPADDHAPAWSPDGTQIAFWSERDGNAEIYVMASDGSDPRRLTNNPGEDWFPRWSPDGSQLTFSSKRNGNLDIYVMNVADALQGTDGSDVRRLTDSPREDFNSVWQPGPMNAQVDTWTQSYAGGTRWAALDGLVTGDGGYLLVGASNYSHQNTRREDIYLVKTDAAGEIVWGRAYGGDDFDRGNAVIEAVGGGFIILGETASTGAGDWDIYLLRVGQDGEEIWSRTFGGPGKERANAIRQTADGGTILVGQTASFGAGGADLYLVKTDDQGAEVWARTYGGEHDEEGYDVRQTPDGGFLVLAQVLQGEAVYVDQKPDIFLLKIDGAGEELWSQVWTTEEADGGHVLLPTSEGAYLIAGITAPAGNQSESDVLLVKIDAQGNQIWNKSLGEQGAVDYGTDAIDLPGGGYLLAGLFNRGGLGAIPLIRTDADGELLWTRNLVEGRGNKVGMRLLSTPDGGYLIVGCTDEFGRGFETILIKTDGDGNVAK